MIGQTLTHYCVLENFRATDIKLNREVALKILPEHLCFQRLRCEVGEINLPDEGPFQPEEW
jgi:hypothetical protein